MSHNALCSTSIRCTQYGAKEWISKTSALFLSKSAVTLWNTRVQLTWQEPRSVLHLMRDWNNGCTPHTRFSTTVIYGWENYFLRRATAADVWLLMTKATKNDQLFQWRYCTLKMALFSFIQTKEYASLQVVLGDINISLIFTVECQTKTRKFFHKTCT